MKQYLPSVSSQEEISPFIVRRRSATASPRFSLCRAVALLALPLIAFWSQASNAVTVTRSPTTCANVVGTPGRLDWNNWGNATRARASDNSYSTASVNDNEETDYLQCTNYGFTIPAGATINGITVNVERKASATNAVRDVAVRIVKGGVIGTVDRSTATWYPNSDAYEAHGGAGDLWGTTWTSTDINSTSFGAAVAAIKATTAGSSRTVSIDHIEITVDYTVGAAPTVTSLIRANTDPTDATSVSWTAIFSASVTGVDATDFSLVQGGGLTGAAITSVTGSGTTWTINASTGSGTGTLGLNLVDDDTIVAGGTPLGGTGAGNGNFTGQVYTRSFPTVTSISRAATSPTDAASLSWNVVFSSSVTGVDTTDFTLATSGVSGASITSVTGGGTTWTVTASAGSGAGTVGLNLVDNDSIVDGSSRRLGGAGSGNGNFTGQTYTRSFPTVTSINRTGATPTEATSVSWTVVFSSSVTGVGAADFSLIQGGGVTGAAITSVTGSGTTWTVTASTGSGTGTLGLQLVDDDTIVDTNNFRLGGAGAGNGNFTGQSYSVTPLTCWNDSFDRADGPPGGSWVTSSIHGTFGAPKIVNNRLRLTDASTQVSTMATLQHLFPGAGNKVVVEFEHYAYGGNGADGIGVVLSDSSIAPVPGAFGGSMGYAQKGSTSDCPNCPGFTGGWLGVGIDEFGNYSNSLEGRNGGSGTALIPDSIGVRGSGSGTTGYAFHATSGTLGTGVDGNFTPAHQYRITVDHSNNVNAWVKVERSTNGGTSWTTVIPNYDAKAQAGQAAVPANWLMSYTGSTGASTNIHEIDNLQVCASSQVSIAGFDHIEIQHASGSGLTCSPSTLTIKACADAACSSLYTGGVTGTLSVTGTPTVNWGDGSATFTIPSGSGSTTEEVQVTTAGSVLIGTQNGSVSPAPTGSSSCNFGAPACTFTAADAGFLFDVPDHVAETTQTITISAVKKADNSLTCVPAFANRNNVPVTFSCDYSDPQDGFVPVRVGVGNTNTVLGANTSSVCSAGGATLNLNFNASGVAQNVNVIYADVGQMTLTATYTGTVGREAGLVMTHTDSFVAAPATFGLTIPGNPAAANQDGGLFAQAGADFEVTVTAYNSIGGITQNFGREVNRESVMLTKSLVQPSGGDDTDPLVGSFGNFGFDCANNVAARGTACGTFSWGDVGILSLTPRLLDGDYLGAGDVIGTASGNVGRFYPRRLDVTAASTPLLASGCTGTLTPFTYIGQAVGFDPAPAVNVRGLNTAGTVTQNYSGNFWKLPGTFGDRTYTNGANALALNSSLGAVVSQIGTFTGTGKYTFSGDTVTHVKETTPIAPFTPSVSLSLSANDLTDTDLVCYDPNDNGTCTPYTNSGIGGAVQRYGRLRLVNANGSELLSLPVPMFTEYYNGSGFIVNQDDGCTSFGLANNLELLSANHGDGVTWQPGTTTMTVKAAATTTGSLTAMGSGAGSLVFSAPGAGGTGDVDVRGNLAATFPWLMFDWNGSGLTNPWARASFGIYKGSPRHIYLRELY